MVIRKFLLVLYVFLFTCSVSLSGQVNDQSKQIHSLRKKIIKLTNEHKKVINKTQLSSNHRLARYQSRLAVKIMTYEIQKYLKSHHVKRPFSEIEKMVDAAYLSSWVFTDLGENHIERFIHILQWANDETDFRASTKKFWKKGTYLKAINKTVRSDNWDYGGWQINEQHMDRPEFRSLMNFLYDSGVINFKINRLKVWDDFMDIKTNCAARCIIETDRKNRGWSWKHILDPKFHAKMKATMAKMVKDGMYNTAFVEEYYYITPIRQYTAKRMHSYK